jgi:Flagellar transcriptional activator (FlhC)
MRVSDDRYSRDRQRIDVALRFIRHEARTHTIRAWTGLTDDRIRKLYRSYLCGSGEAVVARHRGKSPQQVSFFTRTTRVREESAVFASLCSLLGVVPSRQIADAARTLPGVARGELLCQAFEAYRALVMSPQISFEHAVFLVTALACGDELELAGCDDCGSLYVADRLALRGTRCPHCAGSEAGSSPAARDPIEPVTC